MKTKLWDSPTADTLHPLVESFTVGKDIAADQQLLGYDITASIAHATMLGDVGLLSKTEVKQLVSALKSLYKQWQQGSYLLPDDVEDGHTAIELYLTKTLGDIGKKIHTGRSRNDQALTMMRLYLLDSLSAIANKLQEASRMFNAFGKKFENVAMPGFTHTQKAMSTDVTAYFAAYADAFSDQAEYVKNTRKLLDQNPLGSAAGFGTSLPLNREKTTAQLGFSKTQINPLYCGMSRGVFELMALQTLTPAIIFAGKFASDMLLFTSGAFGYFSLPTTITTGSSIMPHKRNYDVYEIVRGKSHAFQTYSQQLFSITSGVSSGYHRDLQLTKAPTLEAFHDAEQILDVLIETTPKLKVHREKLSEAMTSDLYTVERINSLVLSGVPFRDAYVQVKGSL